MRIDAEDRRSFVNLTVSGPDGMSAGAATLAVEIESRGFRGAYAKVGVFASAMQRFLDELERLEAQRSGSALLSSMSPGEFQLRIEIADRAGHVLLTAQLRRLVYIRDQMAALAAEVAFALDPSALPNVVADLHEFCSMLGVAEV
jgi:hypothetical protein